MLPFRLAEAASCLSLADSLALLRAFLRSKSSAGCPLWKKVVEAI